MNTKPLDWHVWNDGSLQEDLINSMKDFNCKTDPLNKPTMCLPEEDNNYFISVSWALFSQTSRPIAPPPGTSEDIRGNF